MFSSLFCMQKEVAATASQEIQKEVIKCQKCGTVPDNYISLNCKHNFCLICIAQRYVNSDASKNAKNLIEISCEICDLVTELDALSVQAVDFIIQQIIQHQLPDNNNSDGSDDLKEEQQQSQIRDTSIPQTPV